MRRSRISFVAWKVLLYLVVAVVLGGVTRDLTLTIILTIGFAAGDLSVASLIRGNAADRPAPETRARRPEPVAPDARRTPSA